MSGSEWLHGNNSQLMLYMIEAESKSLFAHNSNICDETVDDSIGEERRLIDSLQSPLY